ncbi:DUF3168 domain-containing protein [Bosea sp. SSUT16]|uniref:DUF3168 domain-containing protein n=1 Tax=Bosea spartocytisi TaxID=2773451 RepID=A0A927I181_9HYPH|nr:DUF3168 domain-containing protein [Bosea spartocytisi]MBD3847107.1 DUF3168 domain-containing protein [Bosea spartocytisi]MCT4474197.1 DUF3168 domain-containing protein [Bosea spartocytisi]
MITPDYALQDALVRACKAARTAAGDNIFDKVPAKAAYPRVVIGPSQVVPIGASCLGAKEVTQQVDVWTDSVGFGAARQIAGTIVSLVEDDQLQPTGFVIALAVVESTDISRESDGIVSRARISIRAILQPAA